MDARRFLNSEDSARLEQAVARAERSTAAEFVCAVATESGRYDRAESVVGLAVAVAALGLTHAILTRAPSGSWEPGSPVAVGWLALAVVAGWIAGSVLASYVHPLRRLFVGRHEIEEEVARSASHVFSVARLTSTRAHGGVLVYVSLFERRVVVLADSGAGTALGAGGIEALRDLAVARLRAGDRMGTFAATVAAAAERLAPVLPATADNPDELPDALVVFHPRP